MAKTLTEIALDEGLADPATMRAAATHAENAGHPLVVSLVRYGKVGEIALVAALRRQMRVSVIDPVTLELDSDALRQVPREVCRRTRVLPLSLVVEADGGRRMKVAMADPSDQMAIAEVEHVTGCRVEPSLLPLSAIEELVESAYRGVVTKVMKRDASNDTPASDAGWPAAGGSSGPGELAAGEAHRALVDLLIEKGVIDAAEYEARLRKIARGREPTA